jgi:hypothetical protein
VSTVYSTVSLCLGAPPPPPPHVLLRYHAIFTRICIPTVARAHICRDSPTLGPCLLPLVPRASTVGTYVHEQNQMRSLYTPHIVAMDPIISTCTRSQQGISPIGPTLIAAWRLTHGGLSDLSIYLIC